MGSLMITWNVSTFPIAWDCECSSCVVQLYTGVVWSMYKPCTPPVFPSAENFLESVIATKTVILYCVPAFIEQWAKDPANMPKIKTLSAIVRSSLYLLDVQYLTFP